MSDGTITVMPAWFYQSYCCLMGLTSIMYSVQQLVAARRINMRCETH
jgi:hypothetical protein